MVYLKISKRKGHKYAAIVKGVKVNGKVKHKQIKNLGRYDKLIEKLASHEPVLNLSDITIERIRLWRCNCFSKNMGISEFNTDYKHICS